MNATERSILDGTEKIARTREFRKKRKMIAEKTGMAIPGSMFVFLKPDAIFSANSIKILSQIRRNTKICITSEGCDKNNRNPMDIGFVS
jgi:hypothetical protein